MNYLGEMMIVSLL